MGIYSVMLYTESVSVSDGEAVRYPIKWESIEILDYVQEAMFNRLFPPSWVSLSDSGYEEMAREMEKAKKQWLNELREQGFTAVNIYAEGDGIYAWATKDALRGIG